MGGLPTFNLLDQPWLAVADHEGRSHTVGLRQALLEADRFSMLAVSDPGTEAAALRLLVAVVQSAVRGPSRNEGMLLDYPREQVDAYLDSMADRFDLFHPTRPFLQAVHAKSLRVGTPSMLGFPFLPGSSKIMNSSGYADAGDFLPAADAALMLLTVQAWGSGQLTSGGLPGQEKNRSTPAGVLAGSMNVYPLGDTLAETLLLNVTPTAEVGVPVWEVDSGSAPSGWLGRLVWPSRSYLLDPDNAGERVVAVHFGVGHVVPDTGLIEPHFIFRANGTYMRGSADKHVWREVPTIYGWANPGCEQLALARDVLAEQGKTLGAVAVYGRDNVGMAVASVQIRATFPLPVRMLGQSSDGEAAAREVLERTGKVVSSLRANLAGMAPDAGGELWSDVEEPYLRLLADLAADPDNPDLVQAAVVRYRQQARRAAWAVFEREATALPPDAYGRASASLAAALRKNLPDQRQT